MTSHDFAPVTSLKAAFSIRKFVHLLAQEKRAKFDQTFFSVIGM